MWFDCVITTTQLVTLLLVAWTLVRGSAVDPTGASPRTGDSAWITPAPPEPVSELDQVPEPPPPPHPVVEAGPNSESNDQALQRHLDEIVDEVASLEVVSEFDDAVRIKRLGWVQIGRTFVGRKYGHPMMLLREGDRLAVIDLRTGTEWFVPERERNEY